MIEFVKDIVLESGKICLAEQKILTQSQVEFKSKKDLVTHTDRKVENFIIEQITKKYPSHNIHGEETGKTNYNSEYLWIIDPIDGTTSFFHGHPFYCISIALQYQGVTKLGAVYAPKLNEFFYAQKDTGAFLNDTPIQVSETNELIQSVMATGFACLRSDLKDNNLKNFNKIVPQLRDIRRFGSAALDLCYVAAGRLEGFWEMNLNIYDVAAGILIVEEAGGIVVDFLGKNNIPFDGIIASNPYIKDKLLENFE